MLMCLPPPWPCLWTDFETKGIYGLPMTQHSELRPNYPTPKIPKNCASHNIKSGKSPRYGKVREGQKSGCFPESK